jgi:hypothetical protein
MEEIWRDIANYDGYQISNTGLVRSLKWGKSRILKQKRDGNYMRIDLMANGKKKRERIHRLVLSAFVPNIDNKPIVDHINRNTFDNTLNNLRWVSNVESGLNTSRHFTEEYGISLQQRSGFYHVEVRTPVGRKYIGRRITLSEAKVLRDAYYQTN